MPISKSERYKSMRLANYLCAAGSQRNCKAVDRFWTELDSFLDSLVQKEPSDAG